ncbi:crotonobetainyl-CoA:carnitine CoA-transferase CaiB-like acyl-CoA transferase [Neorhizobium galegae]|uniref:CaiB/BaiF CoA transferase family protein n=1 Tax=Neorhizobium galegae TaxID=399 RepID=UPI0027827C3C|nr:CoA transferase [Neorhizobium galegae]MDQ0137753.1 crotonobetainyl-CoA:carnitine CoA-transferase CaiB-like acyl-CoA transferase [Neorhizobium galegae]
MSDLPLFGMKIVDLSRVLAGPLSTMVLADLGADVLKVEHPERGDDTRDWGVEIAPGDTSYYYAFNRNKRSVCVDLSTSDGQATVRNLVVEAGVVVENFKAGGMERFGLGYQDLRKLRPDLIYCAISGYDRGGEEAARPGYDLVVQGEAGLMSMNGEPDQAPLKFGVAAVDLFTGMYAAQGLLAALFDRQRTGRGRRIDIALYDSGVMITSYYGLEALLRERDPPRFGNAHPSIVPYGVFEAADGLLVIAVGTNEQYRNFCTRVIERPELAADERYRTNLNRSRNRDTLIVEIEAELKARSRSYLLSTLSAAGIPCGEVLGLYDVLTNERTRRGGLIHRLDHPSGRTVPVMNSPWRFDGKRLPVRRPPMHGENSADEDFVSNQFKPSDK